MCNKFLDFRHTQPPDPFIRTNYDVIRNTILWRTQSTWAPLPSFYAYVLNRSSISKSGLEMTKISALKKIAHIQQQCTFQSAAVCVCTLPWCSLVIVANLAATRFTSTASMRRRHRRQRTLWWHRASFCACANVTWCCWRMRRHFNVMISPVIDAHYNDIHAPK